jgi:hypothetical protein
MEAECDPDYMSRIPEPKGTEFENFDRLAGILMRRKCDLRSSIPIGGWLSRGLDLQPDAVFPEMSTGDAELSIDDPLVPVLNTRRGPFAFTEAVDFGGNHNLGRTIHLRSSSALPVMVLSAQMCGVSQLPKKNAHTFSK